MKIERCVCDICGKETTGEEFSLPVYELFEGKSKKTV